MLPRQASQARLDELRRELSALEDQLRPLEMRYQAEKRILDALRALQNKRDELKTKLSEAENRMDLAMVADIRCARAHAPPACITLLLQRGLSRHRDTLCHGRQHPVCAHACAPPHA